MSGGLRRWLRWRYAQAPIVIATDAALVLILCGALLVIFAPRLAP